MAIAGLSWDDHVYYRQLQNKANIATRFRDYMPLAVMSRVRIGHQPASRAIAHQMSLIMLDPSIQWTRVPEGLRLTIDNGPFSTLAMPILNEAAAILERQFTGLYVDRAQLPDLFIVTIAGTQHD